MRLIEKEFIEKEKVYCDHCNAKIHTDEDGFTFDLYHWTQKTGGTVNYNLGRDGPNPTDLCEDCYKKFQAELDDHLQPFREALEEAASSKIQEIYRRIMAGGGANDRFISEMFAGKTKKQSSRSI